ncbi:protein kinase [Novymonas esmeraldas]|uniref:non-specific serine/threonine protein kinase n=1 Tax=Novymonas esmeraldas TaxID=1808958 RepID=A0AAW0EQ31_9TRYP
MQVDIGSNTVHQNFSSIVSSAALRELNHRFQQEHTGDAQPEHRVDPATDVAAAALPKSLDGAAHLRRRSSLNLSRSSAGSHRHHNHPPSHHRETRQQHGSTPHSRSVLSQSPEDLALRPPHPVSAASPTAPAPWMNTPGNSSTTNNNFPASGRATIPGATRSPNNYVTESQQAAHAAAGSSRGGGPSPAPMATVASTQHRQRGWSDAAHNTGNGAAAAAATGAPTAAGSPAIGRGAADGTPMHAIAANGAGPHKVDAHHVRGGGDDGSGGGGAGSGNPNDKPSAAAAAAGGPRLAQTKMQIGMRLRRWIIINRIGAGSFGETFTAMEVDGPAAEEDSLTVTPEALALVDNLPPLEERNEVCIKVEQENKNVLRLEALALKKVQPCTQVVRYLGSGCTNGMNYLVMEKLGSNLAELRRRSQHGTFNIYTTLKAGISCLTAIRGVHDLGLVHRDIKPSNFVTGLVGTPEYTTCYLIDFGLARRFRRSNGEIRPPRDNAGFRGTSRYASVASHHHQELGRVDDLWSLLFMLVEFATGTLPWRKYKDKDDIGRCKEESISPHLVRNLPREFQPFLAHLQTLRYEDEPDYDLLLTLMHRALERRGYPPNKPVEWEMDPSMADSGADGDGACVADAGAAQGPAPRVQDGTVNGFVVAMDASGRPLQQAPRRAAPQPGTAEMGSRELQHTPQLPDASPLSGAANRVRGGSRGSLNGAPGQMHPADNPHNSGTLRVSDVDIGAAGAGHDSARGNTPLGLDTSAPLHAQRPRGGTAEMPGCSAGFAVEGSDSPGAAGSSAEEYDPNEFSPRENESGAAHHASVAASPHSPAVGVAAAAANAHRTAASPTVAPPASSMLEPNSSSQWRDANDDRVDAQRRAHQQLDHYNDEPDTGRRGAGRQHHPQLPTASAATDLDAAIGDGAQGEARQGKPGKQSPKKKKKSNCDCSVM